MDLGLHGRRAAVAGGSAGLGLASARALAAEGATVAICSRDRSRVDEAVASIGHDAVGLVSDLADPDHGTEFIDAAADALGGLDIVVANAGGPPAGTFESTDLDDYRHALDQNLLATVAMCRAAVPAMREQGWGRVVAITSIGARQPIDGLIASSAARAGVTSFLKLLATEVAADGVTVNSVQPGLHATDRLLQLRDPDEAAASVPVGHLGDPDDFGAVVAFLSSESARFITGVGLPVDGGAMKALQ